jgi:hypothetical protein
MGKRALVLLGLVAALGLTTPALMADHGDKGNKHQHGNKHDADDERGWEQRDGYEYRTYGGRSRCAVRMEPGQENGLEELWDAARPSQKVWMPELRI